MKLLGFTFIMFLLLGFFCCTNKGVTDKEIDNFIIKYNDVGFSDLHDISVQQISRTITEVVYLVGKPGRNIPGYFVIFDLIKGKVTSINKENLEKNNTKDYLTEVEIIKAINTIRKYNFYFLSIDSLENIYMNPFYVNEPPYFLRLNIETGDTTIKKGYVYELYKKNWYMNKTRRKK